MKPRRCIQTEALKLIKLPWWCILFLNITFVFNRRNSCHLHPIRRAGSSCLQTDRRRQTATTNGAHKRTNVDKHDPVSSLERPKARTRYATQPPDLDLLVCILISELCGFTACSSGLTRPLRSLKDALWHHLSSVATNPHKKGSALLVCRSPTNDVSSLALSFMLFQHVTPRSDKTVSRVVCLHLSSLLYSSQRFCRAGVWSRGGGLWQKKRGEHCEISPGKSHCFVKTFSLGSLLKSHGFFVLESAPTLQ